MATDQQTLEQRLDELLDVESFDPPESFAGAALITIALSVFIVVAFTLIVWEEVAWDVAVIVTTWPGGGTSGAV